MGEGGGGTDETPGGGGGMQNQGRGGRRGGIAMGSLALGIIGGELASWSNRDHGSGGNSNGNGEDGSMDKEACGLPMCGGKRQGRLEMMPRRGEDDPP
jgi:hypothetical protein